MPPTCRRLPRDFALFPTAIGFHVHLTGVVHQTARSRPASLISLADDTLGGRVQKMSDWTNDSRTTSHWLRKDGFSGRILQSSGKAPPLIAASTATRVARLLPDLPGEHRAKKRKPRRWGLVLFSGGDERSEPENLKLPFRCNCPPYRPPRIAESQIASVFVSPPPSSHYTALAVKVVPAQPGRRRSTALAQP